MKNANKLFFVYFFGVLGFFSCNRIDPCAGMPASYISIYEYLGESLLSETDTLLDGAIIVFEGKGGYDSYTWKLGYDSRTFTGKKVTMYLRPGDIGTYPVRLIATRKPNTACKPNDQGIDTIYSRYTVVKDEKAKIIGKFKGRRQEFPNEPEYVASIEKKDGYATYVPENVSPDCPQPLSSGRNGYRAFRIGTGQWDPTGGCHIFEGSAEVDATGNFLMVHYTYIQPFPPYARLPRTFVGKRQP